MEKLSLGVIGGSGLYHIDGAKKLDEVSIKTPFGEPSSSIVVLEVWNKKVAFLSRHGKDHEHPPHLVPYRANLWAFKELGINRVLSFCAVGGIKEGLKPGDFVVVGDFIDFTKSRENTFYEGKFSKGVEGKDKVSELLREKRVVHIDVSNAYCPQMRGVLVEVLKDLSLPFHENIVYACTEGPRFETPAEIRAIKLLGGDVVGMTGYPEVVLARELSMCYASLCVVTNPAVGIAGYRLTSEEVIELMKSKEEEIKSILIEFVKRLPEEKTCQCDKVLEGAEI